MVSRIPEIADAMWQVLNDAAHEAGRVSGFIKSKRHTFELWLQFNL
jgi:hypothetical protein